MSLEQYLTPINSKANICFDCDRACGGCSWTEIDPETEKPRFEPVPGWTAKKVKLRLGACNKLVNIAETYHITACPLFTPDPLGRTEEQDGTDRGYNELRTFY